MATQVILLERVEDLGSMGDVVTVKPGYARNYLLPQAKALRATKENVAYFEAQKASLQKANAEKKGEAEKVAKKIEGAKVVIVRQASEGGQLYGSVSARDIAEALSNDTKVAVTRGQVIVNTAYKTIGLFPVDVALHPEVKVRITINVARSAEEAETQAKTGKALIAEQRGGSKRGDANMDDAKSSMLEAGALANEQAEAEEEAKAAAADAEKAAAKKAKKAAKTEVVAGEEVAEDIAE